MTEPKSILNHALCKCTQVTCFLNILTVYAFHGKSFQISPKKRRTTFYTFDMNMKGRTCTSSNFNTPFDNLSQQERSSTCRGSL